MQKGNMNDNMKITLSQLHPSCLTVQHQTPITHEFRRFELESQQQQI